MFRRAKRKVPGLNTSSTADISFMLLILFLVTTSMEVDEGLERQLPPMEKEKTETQSIVDERLVLKFRILADNELMLNDKPIALQNVRQTVGNFVASKGKKHIIQIQADRKAAYNTYFSLQNEIVAAYNNLRNKRAEQLYGKQYLLCTAEEKMQIAEEIPQRISEVYEVRRPDGGEGGAR
ncbi:ExbD/TolR family protein [Prevotella falsenii]|uniref:ExbD/TolR family protein n=1 Tax=Prevotella falsenii TaxID=515414 RepID=UPI000469FF55|nr:biopolymer transporter ExbD [Prevotella falsenii]